MFNFLKKAVMGGTADSDEDAQGAAQQPATHYSETKRGQLRAQVEHVFFRDFFFENGPGLIDALLEPHGMGNVYCTALKELHAHPKYYDDEFGLESRKTDGGNYLVSCRLPKPEHIGLCYRMHFLFSPDFSRRAFYTIEREAEGGSLCSWDAERNHQTIHAIEQPIWKLTDDKVAAMNAELEEVIVLFEGKQESRPQVEQPAEEQPAEEQPQAEQPVEQPAEGQPVEEQPAEQQQAE